jgi:hypothetical protein
MNLIQIQEHLKDLPVQVIQSYANGANPEVPPYMALAEMQRRQTMDQRVQQQQQAKQGPMPTVKEQIEQSAGLAGLQAKQMQQAQQQAQQQQVAQGGPAPEGIPQPQPQPQPPSPEQQGIGAPPQQPMQGMAGGGMATAAQGIGNLQVPDGMFEYAEGGILGFAGDEPQGSQVPVVTDPEEEKKMRIMRLLNEDKQYKEYEPKTSDPRADKPQRPARSEKPSDFLNDPAYMDMVRRGMEVKTPAQQIEAQKEARRVAGVKENYGEEERKRIAEEDAQYKEALKNRGFNNFINVMSGIGRGGLAGAAPAYLQQTAAQEAADMAHRRRLNAARSGIDKQEREEAMGLATKGFETSEAQRNASTEAASKMASVQQTALLNAAAEVERNKNELARLEQSNANAIALAKAKERFEASENALNRLANAALANRRDEAPTAEMKEFEAYKNKVRQSDRSMQYKTERELFIQFQKDKYAGYAGSIENKLESAENVATNKLKGEDMTLKRYAKRIADAKTPEERRLLMQRRDLYEQQTYGGIGQGAPSAGLSDEIPPGAVRLKQ